MKFQSCQSARRCVKRVFAASFVVVVTATCSCLLVTAAEASPNNLAPTPYRPNHQPSPLPASAMTERPLEKRSLLGSSRLGTFSEYANKYPYLFKRYGQVRTGRFRDGRARRSEDMFGENYGALKRLQVLDEVFGKNGRPRQAGTILEPSIL